MVLNRFLMLLVIVAAVGVSSLASPVVAGVSAPQAGATGHCAGGVSDERKQPPTQEHCAQVCVLCHGLLAGPLPIGSAQVAFTGWEPEAPLRVRSLSPRLDPPIPR